MKPLVVCLVLFFASCSFSCSHCKEGVPFSSSPRIDYIPGSPTGIKQNTNTPSPVIEVAAIFFDLEEWSEYTSRHRTWTQTIYFSVHRIEKYTGKNLIGDMLYSTNITFQMPLVKEEIPYCLSTTPAINRKICSMGSAVGFIFVMDPVFYVEEQFMYAMSYEYQEERLVVQQYNPPLSETMIRRNYGHISTVEIPYITRFTDYIPQIQFIVHC